MLFFFLKYLFSFQRYRRFSIMQIRLVMTSYCLQLKSGKYLINDISGNIEAVILKLSTMNVHQKRNKMTLLGLFPQQLFWPQSLFVKKQKNPHLQPLRWDKGSYLGQKQFPHCLQSHHQIGWGRWFLFKQKPGNFGFY